MHFSDGLVCVIYSYWACNILASNSTHFGFEPLILENCKIGDCVYISGGKLKTVCLRRKIGCPKVYKSSNGRMCKVNKHILSLAMLSSWILLSFIAVDECMLRFNLGEGVLEFTLDSHNTTFTFWNYKFLRGTIYSWKAWAQMTFVLKYWLFLVLIKSKYCKTNTSFCNIYILTHLDRQFCSQCLFFKHYMFFFYFLK